ncbi:MAG: serine/threonine protein kinase [Actinomycetota bacterium]|nr:serine/threonine protein kinase [Actinomycetota bacterium]
MRPLPSHRTDEPIASATKEYSIASSPLTAGTLHGRYRLGDRIGRGGMADVFAAEDEVLHRSVAVKLFRFDTDTGDDQRRVNAEIRTLAGLRHPGLVMVFDAGSTPDPGGRAVPFLVMELISGPTLRQRIAQGVVPPGEVAALGAELAEALAYVHRQAIVHRDIKPANILLDPDPASPARFTAKLADFGIARLVDSTRLTMNGTTVGTANYLSPEQARSGEVSCASDIYSLGLVLIECLTGNQAYPGGGIDAALARLHRPPNIPEAHGAAWAELLAAMTVTDPARRPSALECAASLRALASVPDTGRIRLLPASPTASLAQLDGAGATRRLRVRSASATWARTHRWVLIAAVLVVIAASVLVVTSGDGHPPAPAPAYPSISGQLGSDLHKLEVSVG